MRTRLCIRYKICRKANLAVVRQIKLFLVLILCAPESRDIALHVVCCMETLYVSLRDATNKMFLNPAPRPES